MPCETPSALITGAGSGIGRAFAQALATRGYRLFLVDINEQGMRETVESLALRPEGSAQDERARIIQMDVSSAESVQRLAADLQTRTSSLDLLVNCAGTLGAGSFFGQPISAFARVIEVNLMGTVQMIHALLPLLKQAHGQVVNMASTASLHGWPMLAAYSAAKGALENCSEAIRPELARHGVGLTTVFPLLVDTPMLQRGETPPILRGRRVTAEEVVEKTFRAVERHQARLYVPRLARVVAMVHGIAPPALDWWGTRFGFAREHRP